MSTHTMCSETSQDIEVQNILGIMIVTIIIRIEVELGIPIREKRPEDSNHAIDDTNLKR